MALKGQYVLDENGQVGMIESEDHDQEEYVSVYYGKTDKREHRLLRHFATLSPIDPPVNARVNGEIPIPDTEEEDV